MNQVTKSTAPERGDWAFPTHVAKELVMLLDGNGETARSMASIASQLQHMYVNPGVRSFCFVGDQKRSGTTVVAANVALAFALSGQRTALIETNLTTPRMTKMFGLDAARPGLSEWMAGIGDVSSWSAYMQPAYPNLLVVPAGNALKEGHAVIATELRHLVLEMSRMFDVVICDAPAMSDLAGTLAVVSAVERTIMVARAHRARLRALFDFQEQIKQCGGQLGGTVYVDF